MEKKKIVIYLPVFNSFQNLDEIFFSFGSLELNIVKIIIIDNASTISKNEKLKIIETLKKKYSYEIIFLINEENYGIGGSKKILYKILQNLRFDFYCSILTSGRFNVNELIKTINNHTLDKFDYLIFSRFLNNVNTKEYNSVRRIGNYFFIYLTKILTGCKFTDPGSIIYLKSKKCYDLILNLNISNLTDGSHFGHFLNILIYKFSNNIIVKEVNINWKEGNIKSHVNGLQYSLILLLSLLKYFFTNKFFKTVKKQFKFEEFRF
tara:strand:- start:57 stop:848 length:792 start_codon:yes stop_codon:yes gene_type:complete